MLIHDISTFSLTGKITKCWTNSYSLERKGIQSKTGFVMNGCQKRKTRSKLIYLSLTKSFTARFYIRGFQYSRGQKYRLETPTPQIMNPSKKEFLWFVLYEKLVALVALCRETRQGNTTSGGKQDDLFSLHVTSLDQSYFFIRHINYMRYTN